MNDTFARVVKVFASYEYDGQQVIIRDLDETFHGDLGLDSLAVVECAMLCEEEFGVKLSADEIAQLDKVGDLVERINQKLENTPDA